MAVYEADNKTRVNELKRSLKGILNDMCRLNMPDAEIVHLFQDMLEDMHNGKTPLRKYKDAMFRMVFRDKRELLSLYNALNGSDYTDPDVLEITTLDRYWFISVKNDVAFAIMSELYVIEQQSTICNNMPLRNLYYVTETYRTMVKQSELYRQKVKKILEPHFITFYNGARDMHEDKKILRLSDAYESTGIRVPGDEYEPDLELVVHVYNINKGHNEELLERCPVLKEYMEFVDTVRMNMDGGQDLDTAVMNAIDYCIENGILAEFLINNRDEVSSVVCDEYTFEDYKTDTDIFIEEQAMEIIKQAETITEQEKEIAQQAEEITKQAEEITEQEKEIAQQAEEITEQEKEIMRLRELLKKYEN